MPPGSRVPWDPANSETGVSLPIPRRAWLQDGPGAGFDRCTQAFGGCRWPSTGLGVDMALISAHKLGGPKGVGALILRRGIDIEARIRGGGQEMGRRSGTENVVGIAGFGAAAKRRRAIWRPASGTGWKNLEIF
jgi:cysteine desulfurase